MLARANGADGARVENPADLAGALEQALTGGKPFVIDVVQDLTCPPTSRRGSTARTRTPGARAIRTSAR